jgi:hypothetical protein
MIGDDEQPGLLPFCLLDLFEKVEKIKREAHNVHLEFFINYLEIYNEIVYIIIIIIIMMIIMIIKI